MDNKKKKTPVHAAAKQKKRKRYSKKVRITTIAGVSVMGIIAILCIGVGALVWNMLSGVEFVPGDTSIDPDFSLEEESGDEDPNLDAAYQNAKALSELPVRKNTKYIKNYLLLGYDGTKNTGVRSDTNIILSVNDKKKTIKLISLLRDTYVSLPGRDANKDGKDDWGKLNSAYAYGGHTMQSAMIRENFRLEIDQYIGVNFTSLPIVVDAMGGLDIELTKTEMGQIPKAGLKKVPGDIGWQPMTGSAGVHHLDGLPDAAVRPDPPYRQRLSADSPSAQRRDPDDAEGQDDEHRADPRCGQESPELRGYQYVAGRTARLCRQRAEVYGLHDHQRLLSAPAGRLSQQELQRPRGRSGIQGSEEVGRGASPLYLR